MEFVDIYGGNTVYVSSWSRRKTNRNFFINSKDSEDKLHTV